MSVRSETILGVDDASKSFTWNRVPTLKKLEIVEKPKSIKSKLLRAVRRKVLN